MNEFDLNEIEEVETRPKKKTKKQRENHTHNHDYNHNDDNHNHNHKHNHNHNYRKKGRAPVFMEKLGFIQYIILLLFCLSFFVLLFSFLINLILTIKIIITPRIFMPSIIIFFLTFLFSGGIFGTYMAPPPMYRNKVRKGEIIILRSISPFIMLIISVIFLIFGLNNIHYLKNDIKRSENICKSNKGLTMNEIYIKFNKTNYELEQTKNNLIYLFNNNYVCFPKGKCIKLKNEENNYICNTDEFIKYENISNARCDQVNFDIKNIYTIDKDKDVNLFIENCNEINEKKLATTNIFKCESKKDLSNIKLIPNWDAQVKSEIEKYYNNKLDNYNNETEKIKQMIYLYENSDYSYNLECYNSLDYHLIFLLINLYSFVYYLCTFSWIFLGIEGTCQLFRHIKEREENNNRNMNEIRDINNIENEEDNTLINDKYSKNSDKYIELSEQSDNY